MVERQKNGRCHHIGIIGGTRGMGEWFARFFEKEGYGVHVSGRKTGMNVKDMAERCDVVVVSVPMGATTAVIEEIGPHMRKDALLMDLTSLKRDPVSAMLTSSVSDVIGCHPLFGPQTGSMEGQHVVLCPARGDRWISWLRTILSKHGAHVVETTPDHHDRMMAIVQGLNHFNTVAMGIALSQSGATLSELSLFSTPAFKAKLKIIEKVFCRNPGLYAEIITMNPDIGPFIEMYARIIAEMKNFIHKQDGEGMTDLIEKRADYFKSA
ncbi:MAG: prephenate dehydrogenase/arogenate dehydrogenase family protein [Deltaproteobacteria bacterium]|nr:prephenate dehydrogenase/arogenate dehydrogenase family protein [Deltaproteobacteria bacterium]